VGADQAGGLDSERKKSHEIDRAEQTQKQPTGDGVAGKLKGNAPEQLGYAIAGGTMVGDEIVGGFGGRGEAGQVVIHPQRPAFAGQKRESGEDGVRAAAHFAIGQNKLDRRSEFLAGNSWNAFRHVLVGGIEHAIAGQELPVFDPGAAKGAIAVEDQERSRGKRSFGAFIHRAASATGGQLTLFVTWVRVFAHGYSELQLARRRGRGSRNCFGERS